MVKRLILLVIGILLLTSCIAGPQLKRYRTPIPNAKFYNVSFILQVLSWEDFQAEVNRIFPNRDNRGCMGLALWYGTNQATVLLPERGDGSIDLEALGHEIFYHVLEREHHQTKGDGIEGGNET